MSPYQPPKKYEPTFWIFVFGAVFSCLSVLKSDLLPEHIAHRSFINTVLLLLSTISLTGCAFFSLREFFCTRTGQWPLLFQAFGAALFVGLLFFTDFIEYSAINKQIIRLESQQSYLPEIVERARDWDDPEGRAVAAEGAYALYGVRLSYRDEHNNWILYDPPAKEVRDRADIVAMDLSVRNLQELSLGLLAGTADIVVATLLTFFACLIWAAFKNIPRRVTKIALV